MFRRFASIKVRLTLLFAVIFLAVLSGFSMFLYRQFISTHQVEFDAALYNHAIDLSEAIDSNYFGELSINPKILNEEGKIFPFPLGKALLSLRDFHGKVLGRSSELGDVDLPLSPDMLVATLTKGSTFTTLTMEEATNLPDHGIPFRLINYKVADEDFPSPLILQIAVPQALLEGEKEALARFFVTAVPIMVIFSGLIGYFFSRRALAPVNAIIEKTNSIQAANLTERVPVSGLRDEIQHLAETINQLLDRLEAAFKSQERFIADASHQLKTPLAILRGELDVMKLKGIDATSLDKFIESASEEISGLSKLTEDLLMLARVDAGKESLLLERTRFDECVLSQIARLEKLASRKKIDILFNFDSFQTLPSHELEVSGDPELLGCLFYNLIENAIKYSTVGSKVEVRGSVIQEKVHVDVMDSGPGLLAQEIPQVFDRFFRGARSSLLTSGSGLGLAIASRIALLHEGTLSVQNRPEGGCCFSYEMKRLNPVV